MATQAFRGGVVSDPPDALIEYDLLRKLPGYTRATLYEEPAEWVAAIMEIADVDNREQKRQREKAKREALKG